MQAVRKLKAAKGLTLCEVPIPEPGPHDCLIQVETASICGTDLHIYNWDAWSANRLRPPLTTGQVDLLKADSVASGALPGLRELDILPKAVEEVVPTYIGRSRAPD